MDDIDFVYHLRVQTMKPVFEGSLGWNEAIPLQPVPAAGQP